MAGRHNAVFKEELIGEREKIRQQGQLQTACSMYIHHEYCAHERVSLFLLLDSTFFHFNYKMKQRNFLCRCNCNKSTLNDA